MPHPFVSVLTNTMSPSPIPGVSADGDVVVDEGAVEVDESGWDRVVGAVLVVGAEEVVETEPPHPAMVAVARADTTTSQRVRDDPARTVMYRPRRPAGGEVRT
jgi:hypothetical protein